MPDSTNYLLKDEQLYKSNVNQLISSASNIGGGGRKTPTAKSLFYEGAKRMPDKLGQYLFYSLGSLSNNWMNEYYRSESSAYNKSISSIASKNPTAGMLVRETMANEEIATKNTSEAKALLSGNSYTGNIVGGLQAPYYWKDFLYCKYYGTIPNNYMITLRRYPTPMLDNLSIPQVVKDSDTFLKDGAGRPVAQAVTWFGGNTGNTLSSLLSFSTGLKWGPRDQEAIRTQNAYNKGLFSDQPGPMALIGATIGKFGSTIGNMYENGKDLFEGYQLATDKSETIVSAMRTKGLRDRMKDDSNSIMSEYKWTSVDTVKSTQVREIGLPFTWDSLTVVFEYELSSVGEVNSKAAMLDILGNLLSIGTNYGNFMTPDVRYDTNFPAVGFPGGNAGLEAYFSDPMKWFKNYFQKIGNATLGGGSVASTDDNKNKIEDVRKKLSQLMKDNVGDPAKVKDQIATLAQELGGDISRLFKFGTTADFLETYTPPISLLTGAPVGEWHLTIGNPCNPIAMIGNLVCESVKIDFSESLGPDDFPTGLKATFTLKHGRDRERGEIESIFNRGQGRLYASSVSTSASAISFNSFGDVTGRVLSEARKDEYLNGAAWRKGESVTGFEQITPAVTQ